jgi:two-component system alkaline phosphatase synthesis response regulator PhoP
MSNEVTILIVDDEEDILEFVSYNLSKEGYKILTAANGKEALVIAEENRPELIILDIMMPGMDGIEVCHTLRENKELNNTLIVFLSARNESFTQVSALEAGGDDYITKPIKPNVLKSRVKALIRRHYKFQNENQETLLKFDNLIIDQEEFRVTLKGKEINLAKKEFDLLNLLVSKPGKVFKREEILSQVWGREVIVGDRTIDVHIRKLREKLGDSLIKTYKGVGYKFKI